MNGIGASQQASHGDTFRPHTGRSAAEFMRNYSMLGTLIGLFIALSTSTRYQ